MSRIRANQITNQSADGAPTVQNGLVISGVTTSTSFSGSGANLTNLPAQATIANNADNRVITGGSGVNLNGEANLTFDGSTLALTGSQTISGDLDVAEDIRHIGDTDTRLRFETDTIIARTAASERLRIDSSGRFLKGLTSGGASRSSTSVRNPHFQLSSPWSSGLGSIKFECTDDYPIIFIDSNASYANNSGAGVITWSVKDSSGDYCNTASIRSHIDGTPSNDSAPGRLEFHTTTSGATPSVKMTIDSAGRVITPNTPCFIVRHTSAEVYSSNSYIDGPWTVTLNRGNHFNTSNGIFTAPVAGLYQFNCMQNNDYANGSNPSNFRCHVNNSLYAGINFDQLDSHSGWFTHTLVATLNLAANDTVRLFTSSQCRVDNHNWNHWSMFFIG